MNLKIIVAILVSLIVIQIIGAVIFFNLPAKKASPTPVSQAVNQQVNDDSPTSGGKIVLTADKSNLKVGESVAVSVTLDSGNTPVDGVDLSLSYDAKVLEPILVNKAPFVPGRLFPETPYNVFDLRTGTASMSAISSTNKSFAGTGTLSVISFRAKSTGTTNIKVNTTPGNTTDSNIVANGKEILAETKDVQIVITK